MDAHHSPKRSRTIQAVLNEAWVRSTKAFISWRSNFVNTKASLLDLQTLDGRCAPSESLSVLGISAASFENPGFLENASLTNIRAAESLTPRTANSDALLNAISDNDLVISSLTSREIKV